MIHQKKMFRQLSLITLAGMLLFCTTGNSQTVPQIAEKALAATVSLEMRDGNGAVLSRGSGFFIRSNLIVTNYHVIEGAARGTAKLVDSYRTYTIEGITATDKTNDLALLKVTVYGVKPLSLGDSNTVRIGETIYVAGNPIGLEGTISDGIISGRRDRYTKERLQMTAPISPGSSGGPVLNRKSQVIGVSVSGYHGLGLQNLNFAIPSNYLKTLLTRSGIAKPFSQMSQSISAETHFIRGYEKAELGDYNGAITNYTKAIRLKPDFAAAYYNRGNAKYNLRQYFAAISDYDTAIRLRPDDADAYNNRGLAKSNLGQYFAAITDYDTAIRFIPDDAEAYFNRGVAKSNLGQHFASITDYDMAIRLKPGDANTHYVRGLAKVKLEQPSAAIADFGTAIRLKPDFALAYYGRGVAKGYLERFREAKQDLRTALKLAKQSGDDDLITKIEALLQKVD